MSGNAGTHEGCLYCGTKCSLSKRLFLSSCTEQSNSKLSLPIENGKKKKKKKEMVHLAYTYVTNLGVNLFLLCSLYNISSAPN